ncbi:MAG: mechanosensitive ion channel domain-containing protein [Desulfocapsaceae bacterium]
MKVLFGKPSLPRVRVFCWLLAFCFLLTGAVSICAADQDTAGSGDAKVESIMAGLSDEQVRQMLIEELKADAQAQEPGEQQIKGPAYILARLLKSLNNEHDANEDQIKNLLRQIPNVGPDLYKVFIKLCPYGTSSGALVNVIWVIFFISIGFIFELLFRKFFFPRYLRTDPDVDMAAMSKYDKFLAAITQVLPDMLSLILFFGSAYFAFMVFIWTDSLYVQLFFLATLISITCIRTIAIASQIIFFPKNEHLRVIPMTSRQALMSYRLVVWIFGYIVVSLMFAVVASRLGAEQETVRLHQLLMATLLLVVTGCAVVIYRNQVQKLIIDAGSVDGQSLTWGRKQFASIWHILAITYLVILWMLLLNDLADPSIKGSGAFILSFFVVPIWMVADWLIQWVVKYSMTTLRIHHDHYDDAAEPTEEDLIQRAKGKTLYIKVKSIARIGVVGALIIWVSSLWNIRIPFFSKLAAFLLDSIIILTLALFFWQFISSWIERKIQETIPDVEEDKEEEGEWGGAAKRGRAYTLLPMLRKFIASVLLVMVTMTLLSSLGVNIGPLLAGAGVIGLAIGFGAQKLVADIFSGFFYLLDDAFRVGEYITAGSVAGTVENISLRNVMLRHHRGMLQIIPHSELGAITNFMRGGIIVKFNLDFPYDAPIDKIRKVIKKVGQKMLEHEEYGKDFILPVKSQGVREIANSVMTIRVKFTAQPGSHFVIRREAYRLITEALNDQGIYYAHRKVIVDLPDLTEHEKGHIDPETQKQIAQAAGAAATRTIEEEQQAASGAKAAKDDMMGG